MYTQLVLTCTAIETHPGVFQPTWFLDLKEDNRLTSICSGDKDYCLAQKAEWAQRLHIDGSEKHRRLVSLGMR